MINTLGVLYKFHPFTPKVDEVLELLTRSELYLKYKSSGVKILPYNQFQKMNQAEFKAWSKIEDDYKYEGLKSCYEKQNNEIKEFVASIRSKYLDPIKCKELNDFNVTLQDLTYQLGYEVLRLKRLELVKNPKFTHTLGQHSRTKIKYDMVKIHWFDNQGESTRAINKNVGNVELAIVDIVAKIFTSDGYETALQYAAGENRIKVDMLLTKGKEKWVVDVKQKNRDEAIKAFVSMELWKLYKTTYEL